MDLHRDTRVRFGEYQAKLIKRTFNLEDKPMSALVRAVDADAAWLFRYYTIEQLFDTKAIFRLTGCKAQWARIRIGRGINPDCKKVDRAYFTSLAKVMDPMIKGNAVGTGVVSTLRKRIGETVKPCK